MTWPNDIDGDMFRSLDENGFDFTKEHLVDFIIDFDHWPLTEDEVTVVKSFNPNCEFVEPEDDELQDEASQGYVQFQKETILSYDLIVETQREATEAMEQFGGYCDSWGCETL